MPLSDPSARAVLAKAIKEAIDANLSLTVHELSKKVAVNDTTIRQVFKEVYRLQIHAYRHIARMQKAIRLLTNTQQSTEEIGLLCGFETEAGFNHTFKKENGLSPAAYRMQENTKPK